MNLKSNNYPTIEYEKGEEIFLSPEEINSSFYFDVEEELTSNDEAMEIVASMIDEVDTLVEAAKDFLKNTLSNEGNEYYGTVAYFMEFHRDEMDADTVLELFPSSNVDTITFTEMVDFLKMIRFGSLIDNKTNQQAFIMDLSFNPELTDELMVIYFNLEKIDYPSTQLATPFSVLTDTTIELPLTIAPSLPHLALFETIIFPRSVGAP